MENLQGAVEAILFASGEPVPLSRLAETLQAEKGELEKVLEALSERYNRPESGMLWNCAGMRRFLRLRWRCLPLSLTISLSQRRLSIRCAAWIAAASFPR